MRQEIPDTHEQQQSSLMIFDDEEQAVGQSNLIDTSLPSAEASSIL